MFVCEAYAVRIAFKDSISIVYSGNTKSESELIVLYRGCSPLHRSGADGAGMLASNP